MTRSVAWKPRVDVSPTANCAYNLVAREEEARYIISLQMLDLANIKADFQHRLFNITLEGKLYLAPVGLNIHNILDIGTGILLLH
jgi:hypothetical protein